ncbi:hypothetical protein BBO_08637 [Beauveria brongniartii RCEF 3172]|uniref:Uncharacterized protein n=1 Tax=Beauveria brongniartii RCEF 3172 TaxID=1081107 RepID=A0A166XAQ6_9HYPO|nr:hypothetical protein BBO_08637 [Beauveria brongniartii RCEF 3172]
MSRLVALPTELLHRIAKITSIYTGFVPWGCVMEKSDDVLWKSWEPDWLGQPVDRGALRRLALTCKTLAAVALQLLYRHASTVNWKGYLDTATSLFRTLCSRPDLAAHVAELTLGTDYYWHYCDAPVRRIPLPREPNSHYKRQDWLISPDEAALFNKALRDHGITDMSCTKLWEPGIAGYSDFDGDDDEADDQDDGGNASNEQEHDSSSPYRIEAIKPNAPAHVDGSSRICSALAALAIIKSPNVRRLCLSIRCWTLPRTVQSIGSLDRLTEVYLTGDPDSGGLYDFRLDSSFNWLFAAAPVLRKLSLGCVRKIRDVAPCTLTELVLVEADLKNASVREMCKSFPALQRLSFGASYLEGDGAKCSYVIRRIVKTYKNSLCYLRLDWSWAEEELQQWKPADMSLAELKSMTRLTELVVATPFLHRDKNADDWGFWASLLAPNLNVLRFENISGDWLALPLISAVGDNCSQMRSVTVDCRKPPADEAAVRSMLDSKRIGHEFCYTVAAESAYWDDYSDGSDESDESDDDEESEGSDDSEESEESDD